MKDVTLLCTAASRDRTLAALRRLGVLHIEPVTPPEGDDLDRAREHAARTEHVLERLSAPSTQASSGRPPEQAVEHLWDLLQRRHDEEQRRQGLEDELRRQESFGDFDPDAVRRLAERGLHIRLYRMARRTMPQVPDGVLLVRLQEDRSGVNFAAVSREPFESETPEFRLPARSAVAVRAEIEATVRHLAEMDAEIQAYAGDGPALRALLARQKEQTAYLEARAGMGAQAVVAYLKGYCPAESVEGLRRAAAAEGWGLRVEDPAPGATVPTLLNNPAWVRPVYAVMEMIGILPGYEEVDISAIFLLFLSLFCAMLIGDAGYGILFLVITRWARRRLPHAPALPFTLITIMSVSTIVWGALTGSWFGLVRLPAPLMGLKVNWLTDKDNVMSLCFFIGAVQLTLAHAWNAVRMANSFRAVAQIGWIGMAWTMFFTARTAAQGFPFPPHMLWVCAGSVAAIVLFMTPLRELKAEWFQHIVLPLNLVSNFVDIVSYIRLYAVGTASVAVAMAFNEMAAPMFSSILSGLLGAIILFLGHALNIVLATMGVVVHGVRLNLLEFASHVGMQWTGTPYQPFALEPGEGDGMRAEQGP